MKFHFIETVSYYRCSYLSFYIVYCPVVLLNRENQYPRIALIPGSILPSIISSKAPPPVET